MHVCRAVDSLGLQRWQIKTGSVSAGLEICWDTAPFFLSRANSIISVFVPKKTANTKGALPNYFCIFLSIILTARGGIRAVTFNIDHKS